MGPGFGGGRMRRWAPALAGSALIAAVVLLASLEGPRHRVSLLLSILDGVSDAAGAGTEAMLTFRVQVPEGVVPGEVFLASVPGRGVVDVKAPDVAAGKTRDNLSIQTFDARLPYRRSSLLEFQEDELHALTRIRNDRAIRGHHPAIRGQRGQVCSRSAGRAEVRR